MNRTLCIIWSGTSDLPSSFLSRLQYLHVCHNDHSPGTQEETGRRGLHTEINKKEGRVWKERQIKQKIPVIFQCVSDGLLQFTHTVRYQEVLFWQTV